ncbi:hypothetical protein BGZ94_006950 [Podila epigama]|nr:hypothetical protein BGZ94_006950 [Podila epigama]
MERSGSIYVKAMDYLLRILLRFIWLQREKQDSRRSSRHLLRTRVVEKKKNLAQQRQLRPAFIEKQTRARSKALCDEFFEHFQRAGQGNVYVVTRVLCVSKELAILQSAQIVTQGQGTTAGPSSASLTTESASTASCLQSIGMPCKLDNFEISLEGLDKLDEEVDEDNSDDTSTGTSRAHLRALQTVLKTLLESVKIKHEASLNWVKNTAFKGNNFTVNEMKLVVELVNLLRPFVPKDITAISTRVTERIHPTRPHVHQS